MKKHAWRIVTHWALLIHIYVSMSGFLLVILFSITGLTLNHDDFGLSEPQVTRSTITLPPDLIKDPSEDKIGRYLRGIIGTRSPVNRYREFDDEIEIGFAAPGSLARAIINRMDGTAELEVQSRGLLGKIGDLHTGLEAGRVWYWIIDLTAILLIISSLTGMVTLLSLRARRGSGFLLGAVGVGVVVVIYLIWVPQS